MIRPKSNYFISCFLFAICINSFSAGIKYPKPQNSIRFTENRSQWETRVLYRAQLDGGVMFLEKNCFTYNFYDKETLRKNHVRKGKSSAKKIGSHAFRMTFINSNPHPELISKKATHDYSNFFIGNDETKWASNVKNYKEIIYKGIYDGIDAQILGQENSLKYNFFVAAHADPNNIQLFYEGVDKISIEKKGLKIKTSISEIIEEKPFAYQIINGKQIEVPCEFVLKNNIVHFNFPYGYDKNAELVIDPILVFACSSGSVADNFGMTATYDDDGNLYGGGTVYGVGYPVTLGAYDPTWNGTAAYLSGRTDVVITKYDSSGTFLQYSTYLGGSTSTEVVSSLIVNSLNELILFGATGSTDFPITAGAYDASFNGGFYLTFPYNGTEYLDGTDLYVAKFNAAGTTLLASSYIGGSENDGANNSSILAYNYGDYYRGEVQVDSSGNIYVGSCTYSADFPTTVGCMQPAAGGGMDGVVFKMNPDLTAMAWSTYVGGSADDGCYALTLDNLRNVYTTGGTASLDFPVTAGALSVVYNGGVTDGYVMKIKNDGSAALRSTYIGTGFYDQAFLIQLDNNYDVFIIGQTLGTMPVSAGVYSNPNSKQFIWKMDGDLSTQLVTTVFGNGSGQINISPSAFLVDICGNIYVCGWGGNIITGLATTGMPVTPGGYQTTTDGFNFYLFVLTENAASFLYGTYFGGASSQEHVDGGTSRFDKKGIVYHAVCAGCGGNDDFPVTPGSWPNTGADVNHNTQNFNCNMGVFKFDFQAAGVNAEAIISPNDTLCFGDTVFFDNSSSNALNYIWYFGDGSTVEETYSPTHYYNAPGTYNITLIAIDSTGCIFSDTSDLTITIIPPPNVYLGPDLIVCDTAGILLDAGTAGNIYSWSTGASGQTIIADTSGQYSVTVSNGYCTSWDTMNIQQIILEPDIGNDTTLCDGQTVTLNAFISGATYSWSTGESTPSINIASSGEYWVVVSSSFCSASDTVNVNYIPYPVLSLPADVDICPDDSFLLNGGSPATSWLWSTGDTTQIIYIDSVGTYFVTATNGQCIASGTTNAQQVIFPLLGNDTALCDGQALLLDVFLPGATYLWSTGENTSSITVFSAGEYWVKITYNLCESYDTVNVNYFLYPLINLPVPLIICPGDSVLLNGGSPATSWLWSTGDTTQIIYVDLGGTYSVTAINGSCSTSGSVIAQLVTFPVLGNDTTLCAGQTILLNAFLSGAIYEWSTGDTTSSITAFAGGEYWVKITYGPCENYDTININYLPYPVVNLPPSLMICQGGSVLLDAGSPAISYLWSTGETTQTIIASSSGNFIVTASNGQCSTSDTAIITQVLFPPLGNDTILCVGQKITLNHFYPGATYLWSTGETTPSINVASGGQYFVTSTFSFCSKKDTIKVNYIPYPIVNLPPVVTVCPHESATLNAGNNYSTSYVWSTGESTQTINVDSSGIYTVTVYNSQCAVTDTSELKVTPEINWASSVLLCNIEKYTLDAGEGVSYNWSTGASTQTIDVIESGIYWVTTNTGYCILKDTITVEGSLSYGSIWFPNSFTPDENGLNDFFTGKGSDITFFHLTIFDRWGEMIFETKDETKGWNGFYKGQLAKQDVYIWKVKYKTMCTDNEMNERIGHVTLVR